MKTQTVCGDCAVDDCGSHIAHHANTIQWQDAQAAGVWPDAAADWEACGTPAERSQVKAPYGRTCTRYG